VLVDPKRRIVDAAVIILRPVEHDGAAFERTRILGIGEITIAELLGDHARFHDRGIEQVAAQDFESRRHFQRPTIGPDDISIADFRPGDVFGNRLVRSVGGADYRLPHTGGSRTSEIPAGAVTAEDADLIAHLVSQGNVRMHVILTSQTAEEVSTFNVVGDLKGSEHPEQIVVVSGHLDSWDLGTGAIDDAAGVAVAMEAAQLMQQLHLRPKRTLRVIAWIDEENLGRGHTEYAKAHAAEIGNHVAAMESDLGASHPLGFRAKISSEAVTKLQPVLDVLQASGANLILLSSDSPEADIDPLAKQGVPAFGLLQDGRTYFNYHHTAADTLDKIVPLELRENATAMAVMGYALASMPDPLPR